MFLLFDYQPDGPFQSIIEPKWIKSMKVWSWQTTLTGKIENDEIDFRFKSQPVAFQ